MFMLLHLIALQQLKTLFTNRLLHYGLHLRKHIWIWNCACSLYLQLFTTFKKCTAIMCPIFSCSWWLIFSYCACLYQVILNLVITKAYFIFSVLVEKRIRREIQIFCLRYINWPCGFKIIHCILCDMSSSIISISLLAIYLKRATCVLSFRNNQVC